MSQVLGGIDRILARAGKRFISSDARGDTITVEACSTVRAAPCPACHRWSNRRHGSYVRRLEERPMLEQRVVLAVEVRRFKCANAGCPRRTFAENIHALAGRNRRLGRCTRWATPSVVRRQPGLLTSWACAPVPTPCCGSCAELLSASTNHDRGSSASMTGRSRAVTSTERSSSTWSDVSRSKCSQAA
ncbi:transposase family protein [Cupriavidus necator]|uniref:transposase family protein n=1 Tax=Cupriavidus necator TaxID=106590 RepID=UPI001D011940|nr:transposase family protein [Cupriavidus necator]